MSRFRPSPAAVISTLALVVACSAGTAYAATQITGKDVKDGSLTGKDIKDKSIGLKDLADSARIPGPAGKNGKDAPANAIRPSFAGRNLQVSLGSISGTAGAQWCMRGTTTSLSPVVGGPSSNLYDGILHVSPANTTTSALLALFRWDYEVTSTNQFAVTMCKLDQSGSMPSSPVLTLNYVAYPAG